MGALLLVPAMVIFATLPKRRLLPLVAFVGWTLGAAMPLPLWLGFEGAALGASVVQLLLGIAVLVRVPKGPDGWFSALRASDGPTFSLPYSLVAGAVVLFVGPVVALTYGFVASRMAIDHVTAGYVHLGLFGLELEERTLVRDDVTVRLVGMMHVGDPEAYTDLYATFPDDGCLILTEGVTDRDDLLPHFSYDDIAEALGLKSQAEFALAGGPPEEPAEDLRLRHADIDVSAFSQETLDVLKELADVLNAKGAAAIWARYSKAVENIDDGQIEGIRADLLDRRNEHLIGVVRTAATESPLVIVPWGALHLAWIEEQLVADGFEVRSRQRRDHIRWGPASD